MKNKLTWIEVVVITGWLSTLIATVVFLWVIAKRLVGVH